MKAFDFYCPTRIVFGSGVEAKTGETIKEYGAQRLLLHYGGQSAEKSGLLGRIRTSLKEAGLDYVELGGVQPNPRLSLIRKGITLCLEEKLDGILAVGGGSAIDSAKAIATGAAEPDTDVWQYFTGGAKIRSALPVFTVLTLAATGSEMSDSAVVTNDQSDPVMKRGMHDNIIRPKISFMDPDLLATLPAWQRGAGAADIYMHTLERCFGPQKGGELTDRIAAAVLTTVRDYGPAFVHDPSDQEAASEVLWCGSMAHNDITGLGAAMDGATHQLGHEFSAMFDATHGASLTAVWEYWARFASPRRPERFLDYAYNVWGIQKTAPDAIEQGIVKTMDLFRSLGMPATIGELLGRTLTPAELELLTDKCTTFGKRTIGRYLPLGRDEILAIYTAANR